MTDVTTNQSRYLVAVSGGPDSMALLDMFVKKGYVPEVAHVNYHKRVTADRDEELVRRYCTEHRLPFHRLELDPQMVEGNFQDYARKTRYRFFATLCQENGLDAVLVAHHRDDLIETYLMQKEKKLGVSHYGLAKETVIEGVRVIRPLLEMDKQELLTYCRENGIPYGIDESNLRDDYARNRIRHQIVERMDQSEKDAIMVEIESLNRALQAKRRIIQSDFRDHYDAEEFLALSFLTDRLRIVFPGYSMRHYEEMQRQLRETDRCILTDDRTILSKEYGKIAIFLVPEDYAYLFSSPEDFKEADYPHFRIAFNGNGVEAVTLHPDDFPITIRNARNGDRIVMRFGTKKISRFFIDRKIPLKERLSWPVVLDRKNEVILLPGLGCDISHYSQNPDLYVLKL